MTVGKANFSRIDLIHLLRQRGWLVVVGMIAVGLALSLLISRSTPAAIGVLVLLIAGGIYLTMPPLAQISILVTAAAYFQILESLNLPLSGSNVHAVDLLIVLSLVSTAARWIASPAQRTLPRQAALLFGAILIILAMPIIVGFTNDHLLTTVLRDARVPLYYFTGTLLTLLAIRRANDVATLAQRVLIIGLPAILYYFVSWGLGIPAVEEASTVVLTIGRYTRYGLSGSWSYILIAGLIAASWFFFGKPSTRQRILCGVIGVASALAVVTLLVRGLYVATLASILLIALFSRLFLRPQRLFAALAAAVVIFMFVFVADQAVGTNFLRAMTERAVSIADPTASTSSAAANRETRAEAARFLARSTTNPFIGAGYGDKGVFSFSRTQALQAIFNHSAYSWLFYRVGLVQGILLLLVFFLAALRGGIQIWRLPHGSLRAANFAFLAIFVATFFSGLGANVLFDSSGIFAIPTIVSLAVLLRVTISTETGENNAAFARQGAS